MATILIVDDDKYARLLYLREMAEAGYDVFAVANAHEGLEYLRSQCPDLVMLDVRMPGMDGLEALGKMRSIDRRIPIVLLTAYASYRENFLSWAADAYVIKSADITELKRAVSSLLWTSKPGLGLAGLSTPQHEWTEGAADL
jgi:two-component system, response regulator, stage 0 sporulation protein F